MSFNQLLQRQTFFQTADAPCPYIKGRVERRIFTRLVPETASIVNAQLSKAGFRRTQDTAYRPLCPACQACIPVRVAAESFVEGAVWRRTRRHYQSFRVQHKPAMATPEHYALFIHYQNKRHTGGDMAAMNYNDYRAMLEEGGVPSFLLEVRSSEHILKGVMLVDALDDGYSAVYSFYDPESSRSGLGNFMVLTLIQEAQKQNLPYVYLGYWIAESPTMSYKSRFKPLEYLGPAGWTRMEES